MRACWILLLFIWVVPASAELYKWVDDKGNVHFSDKKPADRPVETHDIKVDKPELDAEALENQRAMEQQLQEWQQEENQQKQQARKKEYDKKVREARCRYVKRQLEVDTKANLMATKNSDGSRTYWTEEERQAYREELQAEKAKYCN